MAELSFFDRLKNGWNAFRAKERENYQPKTTGYSQGYRPDIVRPMPGVDNTILNAIYNRISVDVASVALKHVIVDVDDRFVRDYDSGLNECLQFEANVDQTGRAFIQDAVTVMLEEGHVALVPIDTTIDPRKHGSFDVKTIRAGRVVQWYPEHVRVDLYNERVGRHEELVVPKRACAIIYNPFYMVMNSPNSTLRRLIKTLATLDAVNDKIGSKKLDIIIQLPYRIRSDALKEQAEVRRKAVEEQLTSSEYGVAYADNTEKIVQLNRPIESNLQASIDSLTDMLYGQLSLTREVMSGTADEQVMLNYNNRTLEPILSAFCDELTRKFITRTGRTQGQRIKFFKDPFKLVAVNQIADIADKFTRNEILSPNEMRTIIGMKPSDDVAADELRNRNISQSPIAPQSPYDDMVDPETGLPFEGDIPPEMQGG